MKGFKTRREAYRKACEVSASPSIKELFDGSYVAIGDTAPGRGSAIYHAGGMDYLMDLPGEIQEQLL